MYRPEWLGQDCEGTTLTLEKSQNKEFVTLGSEDGYVFIYSAGTGLPRGKRKPSTKHSAEVSWFIFVSLKYQLTVMTEIKSENLKKKKKYGKKKICFHQVS